MGKRVLVALSGGVDSSYSAYLLQQNGYELHGLYMKLHGNESYHKNNIINIEKIANFLGIDYDILDLSDEFGNKVYNYFVEGYQNGITPNPCSFCNKTIKFGALFDYMEQKDYDYLATGHYAQTDGKNVFEATDKSKDQSYFLALIEPEKLKKILFPLGALFKSSIKEKALQIPQIANLASQKESSEICFVERSYLDVLKNHFNPDREGNVLNRQGKVIGKHQGFAHYTIGQRKGFTVASPVALYVNAIDPKANTITVGVKDELAQNTFIITDVVSHSSLPAIAHVKIRYRSTKALCTLEYQSDNTLKITLAESVYGLAKGQVAVLYEEEKVLGGGIIN